MRLPRFYTSALGAVAAVVALSGCIPIEGEIAARSWRSVQPATGSLTGSEQVVILGRSTTDDGGFPECVSDELSKSSPQIALFAPQEFRAAVGGKLSESKLRLPYAEIEDHLQTQRALAVSVDRGIRYVFVVEGDTTETDNHSSGGGGAAISGSTRRTQISAHIWDGSTGEGLGELNVSTEGHPYMFSAALIINIMEYAPTETKACENMATEILQFLRGELGS